MNKRLYSNETWCKYHGQFVDGANRSEHQAAACELQAVKIPKVEAIALPTLEPRRGWDIVRLPTGYIIEMVR